MDENNSAASSCAQPVVHPRSPKDGGSAVSGPSDDVIALRHLRAGGGDCFGRLIARWSSFMHVSVYLEAESPCQFPVFQTTHFGALVRLLFHELLGLQLRRLLRWSSIGAREGFYLLCSLLLEPWIEKVAHRARCPRYINLHTFRPEKLG